STWSTTCCASFSWARPPALIGAGERGPTVKSWSPRFVSASCPFVVEKPGRSHHEGTRSEHEDSFSTSRHVHRMRTWRDDGREHARLVLSAMLEPVHPNNVPRERVGWDAATRTLHLAG